MVTTQRERIIDAFVQVVAERGYARTTVAGVCKEAGVSSKTFYVHFTDKEDCFLSAYDLGIEMLMGAMGRAYATPGPWPARLRAALGTLLEILASEPSFARVAVVEVNAAGPRAIDRLTSVLRGLMAYFDEAEDVGEHEAEDEDVGGQGSADGGEPGGYPDPRRLGVPAEVTASLVPAVIGGIYVRIYAYVVEGAASRLPELLSPLTYFALLPFIGQVEAARELQH